MSNGLRQGNRLTTLADLTNNHTGRTITVAGLTGRLDAIIPVGGQITLGMTIGGARVFTDAYPAATHVEVHQREAS